MAVLTGVSQLEDRRQPTTTLEGWRRFVEADPPPVTLLNNDEWSALSDDERVDYDETRIAHHAELVVVTTSSIQEITNEGRLLTLMNQRENGARRGLIVSGGAATGKTTAIKQLGRFHELRTRRRFPDSDRIPVVYVTAPPKGSPRKLAMEFARFLGLPPISSRTNATDIADAVCQVLIDARCDVVVVDFTDRRLDPYAPSVLRGSRNVPWLFTDRVRDVRPVREINAEVTWHGKWWSGTCGSNRSNGRTAGGRGRSFGRKG